MNSQILRRPIAVTMCLIALAVMGILALHHIPVSLMPDIDVPQITVQVSMPGYSAQEVERNVVSPLRGRLMQVAGATDVRSEARMDAGSIRMTFAPGSNVDLLFIEVNEKVDRAMNQMPKDMDRPKVMKASAMDIPAFFLDVAKTPSDLPLYGEASDNMPPPHRGEGLGRGSFADLSKFARNVIVKRIEQLPQTAMVDMSGTVGTEIDIIPDEDKMQAMGLTLHTIENAIRKNNITLEALSIVDGLYRYNVHFDSQLLTRQDIENIYLNHQGRLLQLRDVCSIEEHMATRNGLVRHDGQECVTMAIIKQNDARMEDLQQSMDELLDDMREEYPDVEFHLTRDQTKLLSYTIENLKGNLWMGALMASIVLMLFMRKWRLSLLVVLSIPLSLIITILAFHLLGISMNIISLSGLILGVGMMVDNAIIVLDNIEAVPKKALSPYGEGAVVDRVREVFTPMLSSVLTTCSVFLPLIFLSGTAGALFYDQAMGITTALLASLLVATVVIPVYYFVLHKTLSPARTHTRGTHSVLHDFPLYGEEEHEQPLSFYGEEVRLGRGYGGSRWTSLYEAILRWTLRHARLVMLLFLACIPLMALLVLNIEKERMPQVAQDDTLLTIDWNSNISAEENDRRIALLMDAVKDDVASSTCMIGAQEFMLAHTKDITSSEAVLYLKKAVPAQGSQGGEEDPLAAHVTTYLQQHYPQASAEFGEPGNLYDLIFSTDEADLEIHLQNREGKRPTVQESRAFRDTLLRHFPNLDIAPVMTETTIRYVADMEQMAVYKVTFDELHRRLKELMGRGSIMSINDGAQAVPVKTVRQAAKAPYDRSLDGEADTSAPEADNASPLEEFGRGTMCVVNEEGTEIPIAYLVRETKGEDYKRLQAGNGGEYYALSLNAKDKEVEKVMAFVDEYVHSPQSRYSVSYAGGYFSSRRLIGELSVVLAVALALLYFILAAQFESLVQPFIILLEMVIDVFFVLIGLWLMGESLNLMSMTGLIVMSGIIINDSILKIDTINRLRRGVWGGSLLRAIITAGHRRLRPIVMTSLTTILALLPFLSRGSMGSAIQYPLSLTLVIGMTVGTMVSLFFVPMLYYIIYRRKAA